MAKKDIVRRASGPAKATLGKDGEMAGERLS